MLSALLISLIATVVPALAYAAFFYWIDRYEREPLRLTVAAFLWGAIPAIALSFYGEMYLNVALIQSPESIGGRLFETLLIVPVVEEFMKGIALLAIFLWYYNEFDNALDGLVYGALVGLGFAMSENFLYFLGAFGQGGFPALTTVIILRAVLFGLNHAFYTGLLGISFGLARNEISTWRRVLFPICGLILASVVHSIHNLGISLTAYNRLSILFSVSLALSGVVLFLIAIGLTWQSERAIFRDELADEIGTTITEQEYTSLLNGWHRPLQRFTGEQKQQVRRLHLSAELAIHKRRLRTLGAEREPKLPKQIARLRSKLSDV